MIKKNKLSLFVMKLSKNIPQKIANVESVHWSFTVHRNNITVLPVHFIPVSTE